MLFIFPCSLKIRGRRTWNIWSRWLTTRRPPLSLSIRQIRVALFSQSPTLSRLSQVSVVCVRVCECVCVCVCVRVRVCVCVCVLWRQDRRCRRHQSVQSLRLGVHKVSRWADYRRKGVCAFVCKKTSAFVVVNPSNSRSYYIIYFLKT